MKIISVERRAERRGRGKEFYGGRDGFAVHHAVEDGGGFVADLFDSSGDAGEGGGHEGVDEFIVVDTEDSHFLGDADFLAARFLEDAVGPVVVGTENPAGTREILQPLGDGGVLDVAFMDGETEGVGFFAEGFEAESTELGVAGPDEAEVLDAEVEEVIGGENADGGVVGEDGGGSGGR